MPENRDIERRKPDEIERRRDSLVQRSVDYLKEFEEQGLANIEELDLEGWDLHRAIREWRVDIARALIARGDDFDDVDEVVSEAFGTRLHDAAWDNSVDMARLLIDIGANIEVKDMAGGTPLHYSAWNNSVDVARLLIEKKAEIDASASSHPDSTLASLTDWALMLDYVDLINPLTNSLVSVIAVKPEVEGNTAPTPLLIAALNKNLEFVRLLIEHGANIDGIDLSWMDDQENA